MPKPGWCLPERIGSPLGQEVRNGLAEMEAGCREMRMSEAMARQALKAEQ